MKREFKVKCKICGKEFSVIEEETKFPIKADKYFCSRSCANTRVRTAEVKERISKGLKNSKKIIEKCNKLKTEKRKNIYYRDNRYYTGSEETDKIHYEISRRQSPKWFKKLIPFGLDINTLYTEKFINEFYKVKDLLYNEYINNCLSPADIYKKYNCKDYFNNSETLLHVFKDWNFPIRSYSTSVTNIWIQGKLKPFENNTHPIGREQWYTTWNGKEVYLRSSYELDYAKELDEQKIDYEVEGLRIKYWDSQRNDYRCAIPDFYIPSENLIVEIKSTYTLDIQNMKDRFVEFIKLGYKCKCICDHKELEVL